MSYMNVSMNGELNGKTVMPGPEVLPPHSHAGTEKNHIKTS
jgi:hypothetical protein